MREGDLGGAFGLNCAIRDETTVIPNFNCTRTPIGVQRISRSVPERGNSLARWDANHLANQVFVWPSVCTCTVCAGANRAGRLATYGEGKALSSSTVHKIEIATAVSQSAALHSGYSRFALMISSRPSGTISSIFRSRNEREDKN